MDPFKAFKDAQREGWSHFAPLEMFTTQSAALLVAHARIEPGHRVLDVACGTGVVAVTAARHGAFVTGLDLTPALLDRARHNSATAEVDVAWHEGDVEALPFPDESFDVVVSQYGHIFAPRPEVAVGEMLRVLRPGGTIACATWPPELFVGRSFALVGRYMPPPPQPVPPPGLWGDPTVVRERFGASVGHLVFDRGRMLVPALSPAHYRVMFERTAGPVIRLVELLERTDPGALAAFRSEYEALVAEYFDDNLVRQDYLLARAIKA